MKWHGILPHPQALFIHTYIYTYYPTYKIYILPHDYFLFEIQGTCALQTFYKLAFRNNIVDNGTEFNLLLY